MAVTEAKTSSAEEEAETTIAVVVGAVYAEHDSVGLSESFADADAPDEEEDVEQGA